MIGRRGFFGRLLAFGAAVPLSKQLLADDAILVAQNEASRKLLDLIPWPPEVGQPLTIHQLFPTVGQMTWVLDRVTRVGMHHWNLLTVAQLPADQTFGGPARWWWTVEGEQVRGNQTKTFTLKFEASRFRLAEDGVIWFPWGP